MGLFEFLRNNFAHVAPILIAAGFAIAIVVERTRALVWQYPMKSQGHFFERLRDLLMGDRIAEAISLCERYRAKPVAHVVREALLRAHQPESHIEDALQLAVSEASLKITRRTMFLSTIANVATLLGLFGTILGLINSFEAIGSATAQERSALLAQGISTAMNATMLGLGVAIPCMVAFSFLMNRTNRLNAEIEQGAVRVLDLIKQRCYAHESDGGDKSKQTA
jgi:biopolymer transport protein ExbB